MDVRAAVATAAGQPLEVTTVQLVMPLSEINNAFDLMKRGESIRGVVTF